MSPQLKFHNPDTPRESVVQFIGQELSKGVSPTEDKTIIHCAKTEPVSNAMFTCMCCSKLPESVLQQDTY